MARFPLTVLLSSFLLFQVQPMLGKRILPWYGGSAGVWAACLLFFQLVLLAGYGYAHWLSARLGPRVRAGLHLALLAASLLWLPLAPSQQTGKTLFGENRPAQILMLLAASIALPGMLLSSTAPLAQRWYHEATSGRSPYRLYALSNAGSLAALLSYAILVEPWVPLGWQMKLWSGAYAVFAVLSGWCALPAERSPAATEEGRAFRGGPAALRWLLLAACGSTSAFTRSRCLPAVWLVMGNWRGRNHSLVT